MENQDMIFNSSIGTHKNRGDLTALFKYISMLDSQKEHEKSRDMLNDLLHIVSGLESVTPEKNSEFSTIYRLIADNHMAVGEVSEAARSCREGLRIFPGYGELLLSYGNCLTRLHQFEASENILDQIDEKSVTADHNSTNSGLRTYRKNTAIGQLYQDWGKIERARQHFTKALQSRSDWIPAHIGIIESEIIGTNLAKAGQYMDMIMQKHGPDNALTLTAANLALITSNFAEADELATRLQGNMLGNDRFEYLLFQIDFFRGDHESLLEVPYLMTGESAETEAARVWLMKFRGTSYQEDPARIPEDIWLEEYRALDRAWENIESRLKPCVDSKRAGL